MSGWLKWSQTLPYDSFMTEIITVYKFEKAINVIYGPKEMFIID